MEGYNVVSGSGEGALATIEKRIANREANVSDPKTDQTLNKLKDLRDKLGGPKKEKDDMKYLDEKLGDTDPADIGTIDTLPTGIVRPGDIDFSQERTDENISQAVEDLAAQYDRSGKSDPTVTSKVSKAKAQISMPQMLGDVGQGAPMGRPAPAAPTGIL